MQHKKHSPQLFTVINPYRGKLGHCLSSMNVVFSENNKMHATKSKVVGFATQRAREKIIKQCIVRLHETGYKILDVHALGMRHVNFLVDSWVKDGLSASTIQTRISALRTFCSWIRKDGMIPATSQLVPMEIARRHYATKVDKSWSGRCVDIESTIKRVEAADPHVAIQLRMQQGFALRSRESWLIRPKLADCCTHLAVNWGTKGGRHRTVPIDSEQKRELLNLALSMANKISGSLIPNGYTLKSWEQRYYYITRKCGLTRANGTVPHGLRHEAANNLYEQITGVCSPVRQRDGLVKPANDDYARQVVAEITGHSRVQITSAYVGTYRVMKSKTDIEDAPASLPAESVFDVFGC